ncbi:hypothetical protein ACFCXP_16865 [Streptomyces niveus]|uniref:hypothetical protein n=1 Tax=Streptomyces niveus TaxID=193462 RepID=UPI0035D71821
MSVTAKPILELGSADGTPQTAWWFSTINDPVERQPFNQIVSYAVGEYQNIGNHCLWMYSNEFTDLAAAHEVFQTRLNGMSANVQRKLAPLIPTVLTDSIAESRRLELELSPPREQTDAEKRRTFLEAEIEAYEADEDPPEGDALAVYRQLMESELAADEAGEEPDRRWSSHLKELKEELHANPRRDRVLDRAKEVWLRLGTERQEREWREKNREIATKEWHDFCARYLASKGRVKSSEHDAEMTKAMAAAAQPYLDAAAKEGTTLAFDASGATTDMYGCGAERGRGATYRWEYDGTYIYGADSKTVSSERTYWTDDDGSLLGKPKGGAGQTWTLTSWKPAS